MTDSSCLPLFDEEAARAAIQQLERAAVHHNPVHQGCRIRWRKWGDGAPLVLLHGGHGCWLHWVRNIRALAASRSVWIPDMPGYGDSDPVSGDPRDPDRQHRLLDLLENTLGQLLGRQTPIDLAGFSFGSVVAGQLVRSRGAIRRLALLGCGGRAAPRQMPIDLKNWQVADRGLMWSALRHNLNAMMLYAPQSVDALAMVVHEIGCGATRYRSKDLALTLSLAESIEEYGGPTLLVWGEHDATTYPARAAEGLAQGRTERQTTIVSAAGHWVQFERAAEVSDLLLHWFETRPCELP